MINNFKSLNIEVRNKQDLPGFGAFYSGSATKGKIKIFLNLDAITLSSAEEGADFYELLSDTTVHELLHAFQELYKRAFDEDEVENAVAQARKFLDNEKIEKN